MLQYEEFIKRITNDFKELKSKISNKNGDVNVNECIEAFRNIVKICIPSVKTVMNQRDWNNLFEKYKQRAESILNTQNTINNSYYFIDYVLIFNGNSNNENERMQTYKLFRAFDNIIKELNDLIQTDRKLKEKFQNKLNNKLCEVLKSGSTNSDSSYNQPFKNYINEIAFIYHIAVNEKICLEEIESNLPNGKYADFKLKCDELEYLVDMITIHNTSGQNDINRFITGKIEDKFSNKIKGITDDAIIEKFRVLPVIENNDKRLLNYIPELSKTKCFPPMISLLLENDDKPFVILEQLPLKKEYKKQFKDK